MTREQIQELEAALNGLLARQAEADASIGPAQQALDTLTTLTTLEAEPTPTAEGNQDEE